MRQTFSYTLLITWLLLTFSCKTEFFQINSEAQNITVSNEASRLDSSIVNLYLPYKKVLEKDMNRVISFSNLEMRKGKPESYLTNFLGDLLLDEGSRVADEKKLNMVPDISYFNYGGIRSGLPKGEITVGNVFELMPFENEMVYLELDGKQILEFLNYIARHGGDVVGGVRFKIVDEKAVAVTVNGKPLNESQNYWVVTNDYVAGGGDGLEVFKERKQYIKSGQKIRDLIIASMEVKQKRDEKLNPKLDGRITNE